MNRLIRAWRVLIGEDELELRALSFACAALEILEGNKVWGIDTTIQIADEAIKRKLASVNAMQEFAYSEDGWLLKLSTPIPGEDDG